MVTAYAYDAAGRRETVTDAKGVVAKTVYDDLGHSVAKIENFGGLNRKTEYQYNGLGSLTRIMHDPDADNTFAEGAWTIVGSDVDQVTEYAYTDETNARWVSEVRFPTGDGSVGSASSDKLVFAYNLDGTVATRTDKNGNVLTYGYDVARRKTSEILTTVGSGVDSAVQAVTWLYDSNGRLQYVTTHSDTSPDTSTFADAVNQIKNTYDATGMLIKQEQESDGAVDGSTLSVEYAYETDFTTSGNYKRLAYVKYPDGTKIHRGYTHADTASIFQDTINDKFSRVGQLAFDDSGSIGDILVQYDFNGMNRMIRRGHDAGTGAAGNDTRLDLWHGTTGQYAGLDRFGRKADMRFTDYSGTPVDLDRRKYTYDRNSNPTSIENAVYQARSQALTYDDLNRLTQQNEGILLNGGIALGNLQRQYGMDLLGNMAGSNGFSQNSNSATFKHDVNATNEITSIDRSNPAGQAQVIFDSFGGSLSAVWTEEKGTWSTSSGQVQVDTMPGGGYPLALLTGSAAVDDGTIEVQVTLPSGGGTGGVIFSKAGQYWGVEITNGASNNVKLRKFSAFGIQLSQAAMASATINTQTPYIIRVIRRQRHVDAVVMTTGQTVLATLTFDTGSDFGDGTFGMYASVTGVQFDNFSFTRLDQFNPAVPRWSATAKTSLVSGAFQVESGNWGGEAVLEGYHDDEGIAQADVNLNSGNWAELRFRFADPNNYYAVRLGADTGGGSGPIDLIKTVRGKRSTISSNTYTTAAAVTVKLKLTALDGVLVWVDGNLKLGNNALTEIGAGGLALAGEKARFDNVKVGYDSDADDVIDAFVVDDDFSGTTITPTHDHNGNLTFDGTYRYTYDAWNRLVRATMNDTDIIIQAAEFDGVSRRIKKTVSNSGDLDGTIVYY